MKRGRRKPDVDPGEAAQSVLTALLAKGGGSARFDTAAELVEKGAGLNAALPEKEGEREEGAPPPAKRAIVHEVCAAGDIEALQWLGAPTFSDGRRAGQGANLNYPMEKGRSILHWCVFEDKADLLRKICDMHQAATDPKAPPEQRASSFRTLDLNRGDEAGETPTQVAISLKKPDFAKALRKAGAQHDYRHRKVYEEGQPARTQTQHAAWQGEIELLEALSELGESTHQKDAEGNTLLHLAVGGSAWATLQYLVEEKGVSINAQNVEGQTALTWALIHLSGDARLIEAVSNLVQKGADVNLVDGSGLAPLHHALAAGDREVVGKLLELGAKVETPDRTRNTAVHWAAQHPSPDMLRRLLIPDTEPAGKGAPKGGGGGEVDVNQRNARGNTALHKACAWGREESTRLLLAPPVCANQNVANARGRTPLHECAAHGNLGCATALLEKNLEPAEEVVDAKKKPPPKGKKDAAPQVESVRTEIDAEDEDGATPLQVAMASEHSDVVRALIAAGASVRRRSTQYGTLLHQAVALGGGDVASALIAGGADVHARDAADRTPLHVAVRAGSEPLARLLLSEGAQADARDEHAGEAPLHFAAARGDRACAATLVDAGAGVGVRDSGCRTPLHVAAARGAADVAELLCDAGADADATEVHGRTALHCACDGGHAALTELCIRRGADVSARDGRGWTPLHVAVAAGACECAAALLRAGAQLSAAEKRDRTPLLLAAEAAQVEAARLLVRRWKEMRAEKAAGAGDGAVPAAVPA